MKIFLAGGTGVIGRRALRLLVDAGHDVTALARSDDKVASVEAAGAIAARVSLFDASGLRTAVVGHEAVVNLATSIPPVTKAARRSAWAVNDRIRTEGVANLVAAATSAGAARYVQESVSFLYRDCGSDWIDESTPRENVPPTMESTEAAERAATGFIGDSVVLRFGQFYAADSSHTNTFVAALRRGLNPFLGDPAGYQSLVHADDAAAAVVAALGVAPGVYNVAETEPRRRGDLAQHVAAELGRKRARAAPYKFAVRVNGGVEPLTRSHRISSEALRSVSSWMPAHADPVAGWATVIEEMQR